MLRKDIQIYPDQEGGGELGLTLKSCCAKRSRGISKRSQNVLSVEKKKKEDQIGAGSCHGFSVVTIIISYRDFNTTVDCFCSCRGVSDALADFNPLRFSFLFDDDKKRKQKKNQTHCPPGESHMFSIWCFVKTGGAESLRPTVASLSFRAPLRSLPATVASTPQTLSPHTSH